MAVQGNRLRQLRAFCATAQTGSMSRAAERLHLSQPTVSQLVKQLERELGEELLERHGPAIRVNDTGRMLLDMALPLVEGMDRLPESLAARLGQVDSGRLDIAGTELTFHYLIPEMVKRFRDAYPGVDLHLHNVTGRDGMKLLRAGDVDFAVGSIIDVPQDVVWVPLFHYEPMLITAPEHPLAGRDDFDLVDISCYGLVLPPRHLSTWHVVDLVFHQHGLDYQVVLEAGGWEVIKRFVELDLGISIVTSLCLRGDEALAAMPVGTWFPRRDYGVILRRSRPLSPQSRAFLEILDPGFAHRHAAAIAATRVMRGHGKGSIPDPDFSGLDRTMG